MKGHSKDAFSREPEVGAVTAKTTRYHADPTRVPLQKQTNKQTTQKALTVICTIVRQSLQMSYKLTKYSSSQFTQLVPRTIHKERENAILEFESVASRILREQRRLPPI